MHAICAAELVALGWHRSDPKQGASGCSVLAVLAVVLLGSWHPASFWPHFIANVVRVSRHPSSPRARAMAAGGGSSSSVCVVATTPDKRPRAPFDNSPDTPGQGMDDSGGPTSATVLPYAGRLFLDQIAERRWVLTDIISQEQKVLQDGVWALVLAEREGHAAIVNEEGDGDDA